MKRLWPILLGFAALLGSAILALKIGAGSIAISWGELFAWMTGGKVDVDHAVVLGEIRLPRVIMAAFAGGALACAGTVYQALLRNPLADPYTLGVSGGATFGAVLAITAASRLGVNSSAILFSSTSGCALIGASATALAIYFVARSKGLSSTGTLILAGITLNLVFSSFILLLEYFADYTQVYEMIRWMMGGLDVVGYRDFVLLAPICLGGMGTVLVYSRDLDALAVDPLSAASLGVDVEKARRRLLLAASLMTGAVVSLAGPIGFVGLIVPHAVRLVTGAAHGRVIPFSVITGAVFLVLCDSLAQNILVDQDLPVGVITSMLGGPFFVYLLLSRRGSAGIWQD